MPMGRQERRTPRRRSRRATHEASASRVVRELRRAARDTGPRDDEGEPMEIGVNTVEPLSVLPCQLGDGLFDGPGSSPGRASSWRFRRMTARSSAAGRASRVGRGNSPSPRSNYGSPPTAPTSPSRSSPSATRSESTLPTSAAASGAGAHPCQPRASESFLFAATPAARRAGWRCRGSGEWHSPPSTSGERSCRVWPTSPGGTWRSRSAARSRRARRAAS